MKHGPSSSSALAKPCACSASSASVCSSRIWAPSSSSCRWPRPSWAATWCSSYLRPIRIGRKYELHHVAAQLGLGHRHEEEDGAHILDEHTEAEEAEHAQGFASALEELGPCFIKLGQLLSTRPDLLPLRYITALARLQDTIRPVPADKVQAIVESELGAPIGELFKCFDPEPLATA